MLTLRPYQHEALEAIAKARSAGTRRVILSLPTGGGKTIVFAHLVAAEAQHGRVLILVHRDELVRQACGRGGWLYYHTHDSRHSPSGFVDTVAVRGPRLVDAELKRLGEVPTHDRQQWLEALAQVTQVECYVWTEADIPRLLEVLR